MSSRHSLFENGVGNDKIEVPGDWYSIDFHVHSPASRDFKGPDFKEQEDRDDKLYLWLLEQATKADLDIIVITDHNEIRGYQRLNELRAELKSTERTLARANEPIPDEIEHQISLFDQLVILPGVEIDTKQLGAHYLIIFDSQRPLEEIEDFLNRAGYSEERGQKTASQYAEWDVQDTCREAGQLDAIVIAAHADSSNGIYEVTKHLAGHVRIAAFTDENLFGMEFINPVARDQMKELLKQPQYKRETRLAFVQSSDFHGRPDQQIGERRTWVRLDDVRWEPSAIFRALKEALRNPDEYVSALGRPEVREIRKRLDDKPAIKCLDAEPDINKLSQYVCAFANSEDGTVVIGRSEKGNWIGIECEEESEIENRIINLICENVKPVPGFVETEIYPYYGKKIFATVRVRKQRRIYATASDDRVYLIEEGKLKQASTGQVVRLAEENFLQRYAHLSITDRLAKMSKRLGGTRDSLDILPLVRKIEAQTVPFIYLFPPPKRGEILSSELDEAIDFQLNGAPDGGVIVLEPVRPRLRDQYIRITAPLGKCDLSDPVFCELARFDGEKILVAPDGAVYLDPHTGVIAVCREKSPLICQPAEEYEGPDIRFVVAYLKSAIVIWYTDRCLGSTDFHDMFRVLPIIPIPHEPSRKYEEQVLELVDRLVSLEHRFLEEEQAAIKNRPEDTDEEIREWGKERVKIVESHNQAAEKFMAELDKVFFELFGLTDEEIAIVQKGVEAAGLKAFKCPNGDNRYT